MKKHFGNLLAADSSNLPIPYALPSSIDVGEYGQFFRQRKKEGVKPSLALKEHLCVPRGQQFACYDQLPMHIVKNYCTPCER